MSDRILEKYLARNHEDAETAPVSDGEVEDLIAFGWSRGIRARSAMIELRRKTGAILAIGYGWIERVEFDPTDGITLQVGSQKIRIKGRNLNAEIRPQTRLFEGIARHRVPWIQEADQPTILQANKKAVIIEAIES